MENVIRFPSESLLNRALVWLGLLPSPVMEIRDNRIYDCAPGRFESLYFDSVEFTNNTIYDRDGKIIPRFLTEAELDERESNG